MGKITRCKFEINYLNQKQKLYLHPNPAKQMKVIQGLRGNLTYRKALNFDIELNLL